MLPIVDERADERQRYAILTIMSGQDSSPGANIFQVFAATLEKVHDPMFRRIEYQADVAKCEGHFSVPAIVAAHAQPIRNPVTGQPHHVKVVLQDSFEFVAAQFGAGTIKTSGPIDVSTIDNHVHLANLHMTGTGRMR